MHVNRTDTAHAASLCDCSDEEKKCNPTIYGPVQLAWSFCGSLPIRHNKAVFFKVEIEKRIVPILSKAL